MQLDTLPVLEGSSIILRGAQSHDAEARLKLGDASEILEMLGVSPDAVRAPTPESAARWVQNLIDHPRAWVIETDRLIGEVRLDRIDMQDKRASLAIGILDPACLGKGLGTEAIMLVLGHAFRDLKLHRISIRVLAYNARAIRSYQKCGFLIEGRERETAFVNGQWYDDFIMGLLEHEFNPPLP
ncbi:GNAT family N-acetyltransferase [Mesorhizobium sp. AaZ16]|uniref:GNAT family N-acetyltransferase n=1 Tax=Mesorhizobium sp. AaZ16 TaxID=3402289 RepID=UPI00374E5A5D